MPRCPIDERIVLAAFAGTLRREPDAAFVVGTIRHEAGGALVSLSDVGCGPLDLMSVALEALDTASLLLRDGPAVPARREMILAIETASAALGIRIAGVSS